MKTHKVLFLALLVSALLAVSVEAGDRHRGNNGRSGATSASTRSFSSGSGFRSGGGLGLIITLGPWPPTNGWFALFSGISACPLTAWLLKKYAAITLSGWARFAIALLIIMIGRLVLKIEGRGTFFIDLSRCWKEGCL